MEPAEPTSSKREDGRPKPHLHPPGAQGRGESSLARQVGAATWGPKLLLLAVVGFTAVLLLEPLARPGYSPWQDPISGLGVGDPALALLFNGALVALGVCTAVFARGLPPVYVVERPTLVALAATLVLAGVFPASYSFHWIFGLLLYAVPAVAIWAFLRSFLRQRLLGLSWVTAAAIGVAATGLLLTLVGSPPTLGAGGAERLIDYSGLAWGGLVAAGALKNGRWLGPA